MLTVKSLLAWQGEGDKVGGTGEEVEGHRDLVDLKMCSKINTKPFVYTQQATAVSYISLHGH